MASPNSSFDQALIAAARNYMSTQLVDNIFKAQKLLGVIKKYGGYKAVDGGYSIVQPLEYGTNPSVRSSNAWDELDIRDTEEITMAEFPWKQLDGSMGISKLDIRRASGKEKKVDLVKTKLRNLEKSLQQMANGQLFAGNGTTSTNILGLSQLVAATGTVGGIDSATYTWWVSPIDSDAEALAVVDLNTQYNNVCKRESPPQVHVTTQTLYEKYHDLIQGKISVNLPQAQQMADLGIDTLNFKGKPVMFDEDCTAAAWYMLNFEYLKLCYHPDSNWDATEPKELDKQHVLASKILWHGNLVISNRRSCARLQSKTA